jgi:hypothetical protein
LIGEDPHERSTTRRLDTVNGNPTAAAELDALLGHPALSGRWHDGFTTDDVLECLVMLGRVSVDVRDDLDYSSGTLPPRFACRLELRDGGVGASFGEGLSLTAAALRCLIEAEAELADEVERGLGALRDLLGDR